MPLSEKSAARLLLTRDDGHLLVVNRPHDVNLLCMPGGKTEPGETPITTACRETAEETGLRIPESALTLIYRGAVHNDQAHDRTPYDVRTYWARWDDRWGEPQVCEPGIAPRWVTPEAFAAQCAMPAYDQAVLEAWAARRRPVVLGQDASPQVVWRGESSGTHFDTFDLNETNAGVGFFFAEDRDHAERYAGRGTAPRSFTLQAQRVLDLTDCYQRDPAMQAFLRDYAETFDDWFDRRSGEAMGVHEFLESGSLYDYEGNGSGQRWNALFNMAWNAGFDAVRVLDSTDGGFLSRVWVVKDSDQIAFHAPAAHPVEPVRRPPRL